jgi:hypothetical protein
VSILLIGPGVMGLVKIDLGAGDVSVIEYIEAIGSSVDFGLIGEISMMDLSGC